MGLKKHGITSETIKNMILGAGVIYKNLKYEKSTSGWTGTPLGATSGGLKFNYEAQWLDVDVDGATVLIKGVSKQKVGESATLEGQMTELTEDILVSALHLVKSTSEDTTYVKYVSKENITEDDYLENVAYVGTLSSGKNVIIIYRTLSVQKHLNWKQRTLNRQHLLSSLSVQLILKTTA